MPRHGLYMKNRVRVRPRYAELPDDQVNFWTGVGLIGGVGLASLFDLITIALGWR